MNTGNTVSIIDMAVTLIVSWDCPVSIRAWIILAYSKRRFPCIMQVNTHIQLSSPPGALNPPYYMRALVESCSKPYSHTIHLHDVCKLYGLLTYKKEGDHMLLYVDYYYTNI